MTKVDMSPKAVTARLKLMDELWELSVKLKKAGEEAKDNIDEPEKSRRDEIFVDKDNKQ